MYEYLPTQEPSVISSEQRKAPRPNSEPSLETEQKQDLKREIQVQLDTARSLGNNGRLLLTKNKRNEAILLFNQAIKLLDGLRNKYQNQLLYDIEIERALLLVDVHDYTQLAEDGSAVSNFERIIAIMKNPDSRVSVLNGDFNPQKHLKEVLIEYIEFLEGLVSNGPRIDQSWVLKKTSTI